MNNTVTVSEAIKKGHRMVTYPVMAIMFGIIGVCIYLSMSETISVWIIPVGIGVAFIFAWLYWSIMITKWRVWAFDNVNNVHELKKRAIREKLIWGDNNLFEKTEIRSSAEQEHLDALQSKFKKADVFEDDAAVPAETIIYYAKGKNLLQMISGLLVVAGGIYGLVTSESYWISIGLIMGGVILVFTELRQATNRKPQIIINNKGMQTISTPFYKWSEISNEEVTEELRNPVRFYLTYDHPSGKEELQINNYATNRNQLENLIHIYRGRNMKKN